MPITKTAVEALTPDTSIWDDGRGSVAGFGVRRQRIAQVFVYKYNISGRSKWISIGRYGAPWTVDSARTEAKRLSGLLASGQDPASKRDERAQQNRVPTVGDICDLYLKAALSGAILTRFNRPKKQSTLKIDVGRIERHIKPLIGERLITEVDAKIVKHLIRDISLGKTATDKKTITRGRAIVTGGAGTAARVADLMSGIMAWAIDEDYITNNPVHRIRRYRGEPKQRFLNDNELHKLGLVLKSGSDLKGKPINELALTIVKLLALTGCRLNEIAGLRWSEVDIGQSCLRLTDTKSGHSLRAIGEPAAQCLSNAPKLAGSEWVFSAARGDGHYQGTKREACRIFEAAGLQDCTCHTLRHTFASHASGFGYSDATIAGLLGHRGRGITSRYIHRPDAALLSAAEIVSAHINAHLERN